MVLTWDLLGEKEIVRLCFHEQNESSLFIRNNNFFKMLRLVSSVVRRGAGDALETCLRSQRADSLGERRLLLVFEFILYTRFCVFFKSAWFANKRLPF